MTEPTYLYGYGKRRHIQTPEKASGYSFCDKTSTPRYFTDEEMADDYRRWNRNGAERQRAESYIQAARTLPVCKRCQKAWNRQASVARNPQ